MNTSPIGLFLAEGREVGRDQMLQRHTRETRRMAEGKLGVVQFRIDRLQLLLQAHWELIRDRLRLAEETVRLRAEAIVEREMAREDVDMSMLWMAGMGMLANDIADGASKVAAEALSGSVGAARHSEVREMQHQVERLSLLNQAMWELICDRLNLSDADIEAKAREVDMRDGIADGKMTAHAVTCPSCNRVCNSKHHKCIYCGQLFERPVFG